MRASHALLGSTLAIFALLATGCSAQAPPPVSDKVAQYYSNPATPKVAAASDPTVMLNRVRETITTADPLIISVLGDAAGDERGEWVDLYGQHLAKYGTVTVHFWDSKVKAYSQKTETYPGPERQIEIWNGSMHGSSQNGLENLTAMQPQRPSFVFLNYGHSQVADSASASIWRLTTAIDEKWGETDEVVILQNPSINSREQYSARSVAEIKGYALRFGRPVVDVEGAFTKKGLVSALLEDDVYPNAAGSRLWADTVIGLFG